MGSATLSPPTLVKLSASSSPLLLVFQKLSSLSSSCGSTLLLTVSPQLLSPSTPQILTSWRSPHVVLMRPSSPPGCFSDTWLSASMLELLPADPHHTGSSTTPLDPRFPSGS